MSLVSAVVLSWLLPYSVLTIRARSGRGARMRRLLTGGLSVSAVIVLLYLFVLTRGGLFQ